MEERFQTLKIHVADVHCVAVELDGKLFASAGEGGILIIWNVKSGKPRLEVRFGCRKDIAVGSWVLTGALLE